MDLDLDKAIEFHRSGNKNCGADLVKEDTKACLTFYKPGDCTGRAAQWVSRWDALKRPSFPDSQSSSAPPPALVPPSLLQWKVPYTRSAVDYLVLMPSLSGVSR